MHNLQYMIDGLAAQMQRERANVQMTLGNLIDRLAEMQPDTEIEAFGNPHSYRGYYCDLAFEKTEGKTTAGELLEMVRGCMGEVFEGYKGGEFQMGRNTPVWIAEYGCCGRAISAVRDDGILNLLDDE